MELTPQLVREAILPIPSHDRKTWLDIGMAIHSGLGDKGWPVWSEWSKRSDNYDARSCVSTWKSFKAGGGITIGTLFHLAKEHGWKPLGKITAEDWKRIHRTTQDIRSMQARLDRERDDAAAAASKTASRMLEEARFDVHPYLAAKGFSPSEADSLYLNTQRTLGKGLVRHGKLLVPMRDVAGRSGRLTAVQEIDEDGSKRFQPAGCRVRGSGHVCGARGADIIWYCEGYVTALSLFDALQRCYRSKDAVVAGMSAANMRLLARESASLRSESRLVVMADNDDAGIKAARDTGLPWWTPSMMPHGSDANDFRMLHGAEDLAGVLTEITLRLGTGVRGEITL